MMKSEIGFTNYKLKVTITIGAFLTILIIVLAVLYRYEFSVILLTIAGVIGGIGVITFIGLGSKVISKARIRGIEIGILKQDLRLKTYQADKAELEAKVLSFSKSQRLITMPDFDIRFIEAMTESNQALLPASVSQERIDLLTALDNVQRCLIVGASDSGKTTLLQHIVQRRQTVKTLVIDPHASPNKWGNAQVVGIGSNHEQIELALDKLVDLMIERYQDIAQGIVREGEHEQLCIVIDEWMSIAYQCDNAQTALMRLLTESRKAAYSIFVGSHSERVKSLGLDGRGDLREGFVIVKLSVLNGQRTATIDYGEGAIQAVLPGAFNQNNLLIDSSEYINLDVQPNATEAYILHLYEQGETISNIAEIVFGHRGGNQNQRVKDVLLKFGYDV